MQDASKRRVFTSLLQKSKQAPIELSVRSCLAWNGTMCSSCIDVCHVRAIKLFGVMRPTINLDLCDLCGECVPVCPVSSIVINKELENEEGC